MPLARTAEAADLPSLLALFEASDVSRHAEPKAAGQIWAQTLARDWLPGELRRTIFINTGSEATEVALRMAKMYTDGYEILALGGAWHGM